MNEILATMIDENRRLMTKISSLEKELLVKGQEPNKASLYAKKARVMSLLADRIPESGKHQQGWRYATSEDVKNSLRLAMGEAGLSLSFEVDSYEISRDDNRVAITAMMAFTLQCSETGAAETHRFPAEAVDYGRNIAADKTFYKLYTASEKYFLKTTFLVASGDELDSDADAPPKAPKAEKSAAPKAKKSAPPAAPPPTENGKANKQLDDFLSRTTIEMGLTDDETRAILRELGHTGFNPTQADEMFKALDAQLNDSVTTPTGLLVLANRETGGHYKHIKHLENAIKKLDLGIEYPPKANEPVHWQTLLAALIDHGHAPKAE